MGLQIYKWITFNNIYKTQKEKKMRVTVHQIQAEAFYRTLFILLWTSSDRDTDQDTALGDFVLLCSF